MYSDIIARLKKRRQYLRLSAEETSTLIGVNEKNVGKWEREECTPNALNFVNWCEALAVKIILSEDKTTVHQYYPDENVLEELIILFNEVNINDEHKQFKDYYISEAKLSADWDALFRKWLRNAVSFKQSRLQRKSNQTDPEVVQARRNRIYDVASIRDKVSVLPTKLLKHK